METVRADSDISEEFMVEWLAELDGAVALSECSYGDVLLGSRSPLSGPPVRLESPHRWEVSYSEDEDFLMGLPDGDPS